jgi:hypothetical protein
MAAAADRRPVFDRDHGAERAGLERAAGASDKGRLSGSMMAWMLRQNTKHVNGIIDMKLSYRRIGMKRSTGAAACFRAVCLDERPVL